MSVVSCFLAEQIFQCGTELIEQFEEGCISVDPESPYGEGGDCTTYSTGFEEVPVYCDDGTDDDTINYEDLCQMYGFGCENDPTPEPDPALTQKLDKLLKNTSTLTQAQKLQLMVKLNTLLQNCVGSATYNFLANNSHTFKFSVDPNIPGQASYNPSTGEIKIQDPASVTYLNLQEELFHAYQDKFITGGTAQYLQSASANIEFESKLIRDINTFINSPFGGVFISNSPGYFQYLSDITSGGTLFPTSYTSTVGSGYYIFMEEFRQVNPQYANTTINLNLPPQTMFNLVNNSSCSH